MLNFRCSAPSLMSLGALTLSGVLCFGLVEGVAMFAATHFLDIDSLWCIPVFNLLLIVPLFAVFALLSPLLGRWQSVLATCFAFSWLRVYDWGRQYLPARAGRTGALALSILVATSAAVILNRQRERMIGFGRRCAGWATAGVILLAVGITVGKTVHERWVVAHFRQPVNGSPNVLLIIVDTLRADHLSTYGYTRITSPNLDRLGAEGVVFENAIAPSSWTLPSHASMLTGRYPHEHKTDKSGDILGDGLPTVAEAFDRLGYRTGAFSANFTFFSRRVGLARGFVHFEDYVHSASTIFTATGVAGRLEGWVRAVGYPMDMIGRQSAVEVSQNALSWIVADPSRPFFVALNFLDPHDPYLPPNRYRDLFIQAKDRGGKVSIQFNQFPKLSPMQLQAEIANYDGAIRYIDDSVHALLQALTDRGLLRNTIVVVTSDHGEAFGEHGLFTHANSLYREEIRVPLIIWGPGTVPADVRIARPVSTVDLPATLLKLVDPLEAAHFAGRSLDELWAGGVPQKDWANPVSELAQMEIDPSFPNYRGAIKTIVTPHWQYIFGPGEEKQLYNWPHDPIETRNLMPMNGALDVTVTEEDAPIANWSHAGEN